MTTNYIEIVDDDGENAGVYSPVIIQAITKYDNGVIAGMIDVPTKYVIVITTSTIRETPYRFADKNQRDITYIHITTQWKEYKGEIE